MRCTSRFFWTAWLTDPTRAYRREEFAAQDRSTFERTPPRFVVVRGDAITAEALVDVFARHGIEPRIENAIEFAKENLVLLARHAASGVDLDVSFAWSSFELEAIAEASTMQFGRVRVPMSTPTSLVVFKAIAGRPKDVEDAETLLVLHRDIDLVRTRRRVAELAALSDAPEMLAAFDQLAARARRA